MATIKSTFKRFNGTDWDIHYFETSADLINETATYKVLTATERTAIDTYLYAFNDSDLLVKLDGQGLIPEALIPGGLDYLPVNDPTFTGTLTGNSIKSVNGQNLNIFTNKANGDNSSSIRMNGQSITFEIEADGTESQIQFYKSGSEGVGILDLTGSNLLTGLIAPTNASDAATKAYVDAVGGEGVTPVAPVFAATASGQNITLEGAPKSIDGLVVPSGERVLVKNQTTASQNGIYTTSAGAWTKVAADSVQGVLVFVENGTENNDSKFYATNATDWILFSRTDTITASNGLTKVGTDIRVATSGITNAMLAGSIGIDKLNEFAADKTVAGDQGWGDNSTNYSVKQHIDETVAFLNRLRGDNDQFLNNTLPITLAGAAAKNRTFVVTADPANTGFVSGDVALQTVV